MPKRRAVWARSFSLERETPLVRQVLDYLRLRGIPATRHQAGHVHAGGWINLGSTGWPDVIACWRGRFLGVEVKRPGEDPSPAQRRMHAELAAAGATLMVVHCLEELEIGLRALQACATGGEHA